MDDHNEHNLYTQLINAMLVFAGHKNLLFFVLVSRDVAVLLKTIILYSGITFIQ